MSRAFDCQCGASFAGDGVEELAPVVLAHFDEVHPELELTLASVRNYLEAEDRLSGPSEPVGVLGSVEIRPVGPETLDDILYFFDHDAMVGRPEWAGCYCTYFNFDDPSNEIWANRNWQENRQLQADRVSSGETTGVVAYVDGKLAGWCNAGARAGYAMKATGEDDGVAAVVCFAIAPPYRGLGLAGALLDAAVTRLRAEGFTRIEAYPAPAHQPGDRAFPGPLALYLGHGFELESEAPAVVVAVS